jgi:hypothetical protein
MSQITHPELEGIGKYEYGWADKTDAGSNSRRGLNEEVVRDISSKKNEPQWMLDLRLKGLTLLSILFVQLKNKLPLGKICQMILRILMIAWAFLRQKKSA